MSKLDTLFARGYYDQGNEPSHHIAYLYNFAGAAWKTQQHVRAILDTEYRDRVDGLSGNDDAGQMSAWYVMSALGLYPEVPGIPDYELSVPRFDDVTVLLPAGRKLHILAPGTEAGKQYIQSVEWNGKPLSGHSLSHARAYGRRRAPIYAFRETVYGVAKSTQNKRVYGSITVNSLAGRWHRSRVFSRPESAPAFRTEPRNLISL